jgi:acyl-CoA thioesterase FadM
MEYQQEVRLRDELRMASRLARDGTRSIVLQHQLQHLATVAVCVSYARVTVRFDLKARQAVPVPDLIRSLAPMA